MKPAGRGRWPARAVLAAGLVLWGACRARESSVTEYDYDRVQTLPHDRGAFTEGLLYRDGRLFESTGMNGESSLREEELETGRVLRRTDLAYDYFGEGLAWLQGRFYQLTWQHQLGFIYDEHFAKVGEFRYSGEGWGLTTDGSALIMSDGTNRIRFLDPTTFALRRSVAVTLRGQPVPQLNELEWVRGKIYANVWQTDDLVVIEPDSGAISGLVHLAGLLPPAERVRGTDVLNGIAYDAANDRLFVTGKYWPHVYQIRLRAR